MKIAIQTVEERLPMAEQLAKQVCGVIHVDRLRRGPLWSMEQIMRAYARSGVLILQDDVLVEPWFLEQVEAAMLPVPTMTFFIGMSKYPKRLYEQGYSYVWVDTVWGQANWYTPEFIASYLNWSLKLPQTYLGEKRVPGVRPYWDDGSINKFLKAAGIKSCMTLPHLCQHREEPSTVGNPTRPMGKPRVSDVFGEQFLRPWNKSKVTTR
jgi:hypothetical protein